MAPFRQRTEQELVGMSAEELLAYLAEAREGGNPDDVTLALKLLVWGFRDRVRFWVRKSLADDRPSDELLEDLTQAVFAEALKSIDRGKLPESFGGWLRQIASNTVADYVRKIKRSPREAPLVEEHEGEEGFWGSSDESLDETGLVVERSIVDQALEELNPLHRQVVELAGPSAMNFDDLPVGQAVEQLNVQDPAPDSDPLTSANAYKILSRFRKRVAELAAGDNRG